MLLETGYWYFSKAFNKDFCKAIEKAVKPFSCDKGTISGIKDSKKEKSKLFKKRKSDVKFINDQWIYDSVVPYIRQANDNAKWNFEFNWCETAQYTLYKKGQHYDWHIDQNDKPYVSEDPNFNNKIRKLSCSILLNDSSEYKGGNFEFDFRNNRLKKTVVEVKELKNQGDMIVFPSYLWHRVKPVTKGIRKSLVIWFLGPPFV